MDQFEGRELGEWGTFNSVLHWRGEHQSERTAFIFLADGERESARLTYGELDRQARSVAAWLQERELAGKPVILTYRAGLDFIVGFLGCLYAGAIAVPAYPPHPRRTDPRLLTMLEDCAPGAALCVLADSEQLSRGLGDRGLQVLATDALADRSEDWRATYIEPESVAHLQYTSGSTGSPKGVMITHGNLLHQCEYAREVSRCNVHSTEVSWQPFFHDMGLIAGLVGPTFCGALTVVMSPAAFLQSPIRWLRAISNYRGTGSSAPNFAYDLCVRGTTPSQREGLDLSSWEMTINGAEPVRADTLDRFSETFEPYGFRRRTHLPCYGMAETTLCTTAGRLDQDPVVTCFRRDRLDHGAAETCAPEEPLAIRLVSSGIMGGSMEVAIADPETLQRLPESRVGEIWVSGPSVARGYWKRPDETEATFNAHIAGEGEQSYLRTGDLGFLLNGELYVTGRLKDMIIIRGRNLYPQDIELAAQHSHEALQIDACAAFPLEVEDREELGIALEVKRSGRQRISSDEVFEAVRAAIGEQFGVAVHWLGLVQPGRLPKTSSGKIMRYACRLEHLSGGLALLSEWRAKSSEERDSPAPAAVAGLIELLRALPRADRHRVLVAHVQGEIARALELAALPDPRTGFERLGLDSVGAVALVNRLQDAIGNNVSLPATLLFDQPNIEALARYLEDVLFGEPARSPVPARADRLPDEPVAVVGLACRFPGAADADEFWRLLEEGRDAIREVPSERWNVEAYFDPDAGAVGKMNTRFGGFIDDIEGFDAAFFDISPREATSMDPQHRHLLEVAWLALEHAGIPPGRLDGRPAGVFMGLSTGDYERILTGRGPETTDAFMATGNAHSAAVGRLSFALGLQGPCVAVDTACSSSLVAVHQAVQSLRQGECEIALAGGVNAILRPELTVAFCKARLLSPDGRCRTFDASADGYVRSEGCGIVVLKRLSDARRDGDRILAVIRGSAVNQDGRSSGLTAPSGPSQTRVIADALSVAGIEPASVHYLECHGTATVLGDPIEVQAANAVLARGREPADALIIGSVKSNVGHLEAAAGIAGLIKVVLALQHGAIPRSLHFKVPNPHIPWASMPVKVAAETLPWARADSRTRIAGVSSFGFAGTNAHVVLEEAPRQEANDAGEPIVDASGPWLLALSARTQSGVKELAVRYAAWLRARDDAAISDICHAANTGRNHFEQRAVLICGSREAAQQKLGALAQGKPAPGLIAGTTLRERRPRVAFLFPGQGLQYTGMAQELYERAPAFRECLDRCAAAYDDFGREDGSPPLKSLMFDQDSAQLLKQTRYVQPALYALQVSLAALWQSWGVKPDAVLGHSAGEYAAACVAGVFRIEDGLRLIVDRARLMQTLPEGTMLSVTAPIETVEAAIAGDDTVHVSAYNGLNTVVSGPIGRLDVLAEQFDSKELYYSKLPASNAFHSPSIEPILDDYEACARRTEYSAPHTRLISTLTGKPLANDETPDAVYWRNQARQPVRFAQGIQALFEEVGCDIALELGPQAELVWLAQMSWRPEHSVLWASSLAKGRNAYEQVLTAAAQIHARGITLDFAVMAPGARARRTFALPSYPFQHERYWAGPMGGDIAAALGDSVYQVRWKASDGLPPSSAARQQRWLILAGEADLGAALEMALRARGQESVRSERIDGNATSPAAIRAMLETARRQAPVDHVVHVAGSFVDSDGGGDAVREAQSSGVMSALLVAQALISTREATRLWLVTRGVHAVLDDEQVEPTHAPVWGFGRTFAVEHPDRYGGLIDLALGRDSTATAADLAGALLRDDGGDQVAVRDGKSWTARFRREPVRDESPLRVRADAAYLITGGTGALGLMLARHLAGHGARQIVLTSRSGGNEAAGAVIKALADSGCRVDVYTADVSVHAEAERLMEQIRGAPGALPLRGIIHAAGVLEGAPIASQTRDLLASVMAPKVWGAWNLHHLACRHKLELDFFVLFSSAASLLGLRGHGNYSAANAYLDSLAHYRRGKGLPAVAINWGPWAEDGMATRMEAERWEEMGTHLIRPKLALRAFDLLAGSGAAQVCVQPMNVARWATLARAGRLPPILLRFLEELFLLAGVEGDIAGDSARRGAKRGPGELVRRLAALGPAERREALETHMRGRVGAVLGLTPESVDPEAGFFDLGMNSIMAVELRSTLQADIGDTVELQAAIIFNHPTVRRIAAYLLTSLSPGEERAPVPVRILDSSEAQAKALSCDATGLTQAIDSAVSEVLDPQRWSADLDESEENRFNRKALAAILSLQSEVDRLRSRTVEPVAVIGLSCRYPGANDPEAFWRIFDEGRDEITEIPASRWDAATHYDADPDMPGKMNTRWGGFLSDVEMFDAGFFGISPREALSLDPQQRILLEVAWEALENAGLAPRRLRGVRGGVFIGISVSDYAERVSRQDIGQLDAYVGTGNALCAAAGRLAFTLGWEGPALAIDTACSSSLVSLHEACASLRAGECDIALAGGVSLVLNPAVSMILSRAHMLSPDGRCKTFDTSANGYVRSEGCGVVALKRLRDAERDGDPILALIRGSAVNQDGRSSGLTVPNGVAQERVIADALANAGVAPADVQYLEAHGTGTPLGDPIEVQAADAVLSRGRDPSNPLLVGSAKSNIGHTETAAGIAGVIKVILALRHERIPKSLHYRTPNPHIPWEQLNLRIVTEPVPWPPGERRRIADVSSFGFVGTNAHVVIEEAPVRRVSARTGASIPERGACVLALSARTNGALGELAGRYLEALVRDSEVPLPDLCHAANTGRDHFEQRAALVFGDRERLTAQLTSLQQGLTDPGVHQGRLALRTTRHIAFLFTGQGSQFAGMGRDLYSTEPVFRDHFDRCAAEFSRLQGGAPGLHEIVFEDDGSGRLDETRYTQPALYALETSLAALLRSWGVEPDIVLGHSVGEYAAACTAGVFTLEEGMTLMVERGRLMQGLPSGGAMGAISVDAETVTAAFRAGTDVCVAAYNGAETVISGASEAVDELLQRFEADGQRCRRLATSGAFHSAWMDPILDPFKALASRISCQLPRKRLISNVSGDVVSDDTVLDATYWTEHIRKPVQFERSIRALQQLACDLVIELGPQPVLLGMGRRCWDSDREPVWVETLRRNRSDAEQIMTAVARIYAGGGDVDFAAVDAPWRDTRRRVSLPFYPFQRQRYWIDAPEPRVDAAPNPQSCLYHSVWEQKALPPAAREQRRATWLVLGDREGIAHELCRQLEGLGQRCVCAPADEPVPWSPQTLARLFDEANADESAPFGHVVHLRSLDGTRVESTDELRFAQKLGIESTLRLAQALIGSSWRGKLWVVTRGVHQVTGSDRIEPAQGPMWGLGRAIAMEQPELWGGLIDLPLDGDAAAVSSGLAQALQSGDDEDQIALRDGRRWVARVTRRQPPGAAQPLEVAADGTYLITGGLGDLGLQMARRLVARGARNLVLASRRMASDSAQETIADLVNNHDCTIRVIRADMSREADVSRLFGEIEASGLPVLKGIIHAAGVASLVPLENIDAEELERTLGPKVIGGWLLDRITRERGIKLSFFVCTASIASAWGAVSQAAYSAANAFLESLAESRKALGEAVTTISYGPWAGLGLMASSTEQGVAWLRRRGLSLLGPSLALDAMESLMVERVAHAAVADVNWATFRVHAEAQRPCPWLGRLGQTTETAGDDSASRRNASLAAELERLSSAPEVERIQLLATTIRTEISQVLGVHPQSLEDETSLFEVGLDSLMAVDLINRLRRRLRNTQFTPRLIYDNPTVSALAAAVGREFGAAPGSFASAEPPQGAGSASRAPDSSTPGDLAATEEAHYRTKNGPLYTYRRYRDGDRRGVLPSYAKCFGPTTASLLDAVFEWKYLDRPDQGPLVDILESSGEIVGWNGALPVRFKIEGETTPGVWSTDTHVAPDHRTVTGWFLHQVDENTPGIKLGMPNEAMYSIASAMESVIDLDQLQHLKTCLNLGGVLRARGANALLCWVSGLLYWPVPRAFDFGARLRADRSVTVSQIPHFDGRFDELWRTASRDYRGIMVRDQAFLSWRFDRCPNRGYTRYVADRDGDVVGYLVTRESRWKGGIRGRIVDYLVSREDTRAFDALVSAALRDFGARGAVSVACSVASTRTEHIRQLRRHGFLSSEPGARIVTSRGPHDAKLAAIRNWLFTYADGDIDYCEEESET